MYIGKLPDDFSQDDVDGYLQNMLSRKPMPAEAQFKHFVYGLKCYRQTMDCPELRTKKPYMQMCEEKGWKIGLCPHCKCRMRVIKILDRHGHRLQKAHPHAVPVCKRAFHSPSKFISWRTALIVPIRDNISVSKITLAHSEVPFV